MRIAFVSIASPHKRRSWSGIPYFTLRELRRRFADTHVIESPMLDRVVEGASMLEKHGMLVRRRQLLVRHYSRRINRALEKLRPDVVVAVAAAHKIAYLDPKWPLVYVADGLFASIVSYYGKYQKLSVRSRAIGNSVQNELLKRADRVLLASDWAVAEALAAYPLQQSRIAVSPMGANLDDDPGYQEVDEHAPLRLLFVGLDWERKGGPRVLETWRHLRRHLPDVELDIVGVDRPELATIAGVRIHGRIDKTDPLAFQRLRELYSRAGFLVMLSKQEAYGLVCCEAAAFGRPSVAARTGGIATIIKDGETGLLVDPDESPDKIARRILDVWSQREVYRSMCQAARQRYRTLLNWEAWGDRVQEAIEDVLAERAGQSGGSAGLRRRSAS